MCKANKANQRTLISISSVALTFSDGSEITFDNPQECCEWNYADFEQIEDTIGTVYKGNMRFEKCDKGFRFGTTPDNMTFVPYHSEQGGTIAGEVDIFWNGKLMLKALGEWINR